MINPKVLTFWRHKRNLSLEQLASKSRVDVQTIHRIETGKTVRARQRTIARIAEALKIKADVLTAEGDPAEEEGSLLSYRSDFKVRMGIGQQNAIDLVSIRYRVPRSFVVELAPLLFAWAAEKSLGRRAERMEEFASQIADIESKGSFFRHLSSRLTYHHAVEEIFEHEEKSITAKDIFASAIPYEGGSIGGGDDEDVDNPFAIFLADLVAEIPRLGTFQGASQNGSPDYEILEDVARAIVGGDEDAARALVIGTVKFDAMPSDVRSGSTESRAEWVNAAAQERSRKFDEAFPEIAKLLEEQLGDEE